MRKVLNKNNLIFILIIMTLFNLMMPTISYAANISINDMLKETVAAWYMILRAIAIGCMILLFLVLAMKAAVTRNAGDSALLKTMIKDWVIALLLVIFIHYFMIAAINLNEMAVAGSESLGQSLSGMEEDQEISLYESAITKAYEVKFTPGTIGMILYMMLVYYAYKFTFIYLKRYINVLALILLAPIVCVFYAFRKVLSGKKVALGKWFKEFIYNVFLQSLHAILYASVIGLTLKLSDDGENFVGAILTLIVFGFIFKVDKLVRKVFNTVGGDTSVPVSRVESIAKNALSTAKSVGTSQAGSGMAAAFGESSQIGSKLKNKFGDGLSPSLITDGIKSDASLAFTDMKYNFKSNMDEVKGIVEDLPDTMAGKNKQVTKEQIAKEEEKMKNAGVLGKAWFAVLGAPEYVSNKIKEIKSKTEEVKLYLENKKNDAINYINDLQKDIETIRTIPSLIREVRQLPSVVIRPKTGRKGNNVDPRYQALFDTDIDTTELKNRYQKMFELSSGGVVTTAALAQGYEVFLRAPKMGLMVLAEQNYKNMVHVEVPMENRRVVAGYKRESTPKYHFSNFENGSIETIEQCIVIDACKIFAGLRSLQRVAAGVQKGTITYRSVPEGADTTVIHYRGKGNAARKLHMNTQLLVERLNSFRSDTQVAVNINLLNQLELMQNKDVITNLSPEMLGMLEQAGVVRKFENNGKVGYIVLDKAIENVVKTKKINDFIDSNPENPLAQKINQFLTDNSNSEMAIKISDYVIENPDSVLAKVVDKIGIAEDGSLFLKVDSFNVGEQVPDFSQLGVVKENQIEQMIVTEDGQLLKQVIDLQGNIIIPATDQEGNVVELPSVNGVVVQRILTPEGKIVQQVLSQDGTTVKPIVYVNTLEQKPIVTSINNVEGVVTQVMPDAGKIQIIDKATGEIKEIKPEEGTIQIVKNEDGSIQLVNTKTNDTILVDEKFIIQVIKPQDSMIQVINVENQTLEIASGENALKMLIDQGIGVTQKEKQEFITGIRKAETEVVKLDKIDGVITQIAPLEGEIQILNKKTGKVETLDSQDVTIQIVKTEEGTIKLVNMETQEEIKLGNEYVVQVVKPQESTIQVINVKNQTIETAIGENALLMAVEQNLALSPSVKENLVKGIKEASKTSVVKLNDVQGVVTEIAPLEGEIQIVNKDTGKVETLQSQNSTIQVVKNEDGSIQLVNTETQEVVNLGEEYVVQVVKSKDATVQIIDLKNKTIETAKGENALMMAVEQSIEIAPALKDEFIAGIKDTSKPKVDKIDDIKGIVTQIAPLEGEIQILNKETGKVESIRPEDVTIQIVKSEDGSIQLVNTETQEVINLGEEYVVQVVKPKEAEVQVIDMSTQTVETASGKTALRMVVEQGIEIAPSIKEQFVTVVKEGVKPKAGIEKFESVTGIVTEIAPFVGEIQIVNKQTGKTKSVNAQSGTFQVVKNKDGSVQLVNTETSDTILLDEDSIVQVINPQESIMKTINVENQTIETTSGDVATRVIQEQQLRERVKEDLAEMVQPVALDLSTGTTEPVVDLSLETQILSTVVENIITEPNYELTEENRLNKLNGLLGQIAELQGEQTAEELIEALKAESEKVLVEVGTETKQLKQLTEMSMPIDPAMFTTTASSAENELSQLVEILQQGRTDTGVDSTPTETYSYTDTYEEDNTPSSMMDTIKAYLSQNDTVDTTSYTDDIGTTSYYDTEFTDYVDTTVADTVDTTISDTQRFYNDILRKVTGKSTSTTTVSIEDSVEYSQNVLDNVVEAVGVPVEESTNSSKSTTMNLLNEVLKKTTGKTITPQVEDSVRDAVFETVVTEETERRTKKKNKFLRHESVVDKTPKNQKTEEPKSEGIYFSVTGAVVSEGRVWIQIGKKVREVIELVGGFTENADRKAIESLLNTIIDKNNASIHVPEIEMIEVEVTGEVRNPGTYFMKCNYSTVRDAIEAAGGWTEKSNKKALKEQLNGFITKTTMTIDVPKLRKGETNDDDTDVEIIRCHISGEVASPGEKELNKGSTVSDLIVKAGHLTGRENQQAIQLNCGRFVDINYVLSNNDSIFIPRLEYEESDKRRGYSTSDIKDAIREEFKQYKLRNPKKEKETEAQYLQALRKNKNIMYMISKKISTRLKDKKIILTIDEIENRLDDFLKKEIEKQRGIKSQEFSDLLDNVTMFSGDQIQGASDRVAKRLSTEKVIISRGKTKKERAASMLFEEIQNILNNDDINNKKYTETT